MLNEKQWRQYLALEAQERGSVRQVAEASQGLIQYDSTWNARTASGRWLHPKSQTARARGGREKVIEKDAKLLADLESLQ